MGPNKYQLILIVIIAVLWLGIGNLIIYDAIRRKKLSFVHMLNPLIIFKFDKRDWGKVLLLTISIIGISWLTISLENKTGPDRYQLILIGTVIIFLGLIAVLLVGTVCLKIYDAFLNKKISEILNPLVIFGFDKSDWVKTLLLIILVAVLLCLIILFYLK